MAVNVQSLFGFRTGRDAWVKYQDKVNNDRAVQWLIRACEKYRQREIAEIIGSNQKTVSRWIRNKKIPAKFHHELYVLHQI